MKMLKLQTANKVPPSTLLTAGGGKMRVFAKTGANTVASLHFVVGYAIVRQTWNAEDPIYDPCPTIDSSRKSSLVP